VFVDIHVTLTDSRGKLPHAADRSKPGVRGSFRIGPPIPGGVD
jgi:hypothetical protein